MTLHGVSRALRIMQNHQRINYSGSDISDIGNMSLQVRDGNNNDVEALNNVDNSKYKRLELENEKLRRDLSRYKSRGTEPSVPIPVKSQPQQANNEQDRARIAVGVLCFK